MTRIPDTAGHTDRKVFKSTIGPQEHANKLTPLVTAGLEDKWQNRAGEEFEDTDNASSEECRLANAFAQDHGGFDDGLD